MLNDDIMIHVIINLGRDLSSLGLTVSNIVNYYTAIGDIGEFSVSILLWSIAEEASDFEVFFEATQKIYRTITF